MSLAQEKYLFDDKGKKKAVVVDIKRYKQLMEDLHDLAVVAERRKEKPISLSQMKHRKDVYRSL